MNEEWYFKYKIIKNGQLCSEQRFRSNACQFSLLRVPVGTGVFLYPFIRDSVTKKVGHLSL